ncbi:hypothetical protein OG429_24040 [Streptomyces sp. NBC_00190]|uniref:hypothetical protein n=1 Tax=Streptomyces sp. NBC_00868 TaxID=2903683 RepID=UPI002E2CFCD1|nr:hypothetical protein [Streptomyces sp. NBC_00190]WSZ42090.1 hypothetical protein OG239_26815 [Streptomyces sp. NBC_00868]
MSHDWRWEYDPDHAHVAGGIPVHVVAEVERLAGLVRPDGRVTVTDFGIARSAAGPRLTASHAMLGTAYYIKDYAGQNCLTDNGPGKELAVTTCTPGIKTQQWYVP